MIWPKVNIQINGEQHVAIAPLIVSASRATDIPAFYAKEFIECLDKSYLFWTNPFNGKKSTISLSKTKFIVFWTKNAGPIIPYLRKINSLGINFYFNYTLNNYEKEKLERNLPPLAFRINTFKQLSSEIGRDRVIWRFDPIILSKGQDEELLIDRIVQIAEQIHGHTNKLVLSFVDYSYKKVRRNLEQSSFEPFIPVKNQFIKKLFEAIQAYHLEIFTCAEPEELDERFAKRNKCIDQEMISKLSANDKELIEFIDSLKTKGFFKDKGQRRFCGCFFSKDIGRYNSCKYSCSYCYAGNVKATTKKTNIFE
jgi:DNA repair photolyase